jgi:transposase-like protein
MEAKRKRQSEAFKAKVGFETLVGLKTVAQLAREYAVHPTLYYVNIHLRQAAALSA